MAGLNFSKEVPKSISAQLCAPNHILTHARKIPADHAGKKKTGAQTCAAVKFRPSREPALWSGFVSKLGRPSIIVRIVLSQEQHSDPIQWE